ncbi:MAG: hypothetical protein IH589_13725 [Anaerolineales bacterium]|nr:hypothetical protein [Anaerolineales bacterium]
MKQFLLITLLSLILSGCLINAQEPTINPIELQEISIQATGIYLTQAANATAITAPPTTDTPQAEGITPFFRDDFDTELQPGWIWVNEDKKNWNLSTRPGTLMINIQGGYVSLGNAANLLLRSAPEGDFMIETAVSALPEDNNQFAGLILYESDKNYIQMGNSFCSPVNGCTGQGIYIDTYRDGGLMLPRIVNKANLAYAAFRVIRHGSVYSFYMSSDGKLWYLVHQTQIALNVFRVGLVTGQNVDDLIPSAYYDYFIIEKVK